MKKVLIIASSGSVHTSRWINQISDQDLDIHLFPSMDVGEVHAQMSNVTVYHTFYSAKTMKNSQIESPARNRGIPIPFVPFKLVLTVLFVFRTIMERILLDHYVRRLRKLIKKLKPDIIHSMEFQHAGYLTLQALYKECIETFSGEIVKYLHRLRKGILQENAQQPVFQLAEKRLVGQTSKWVATNWGSDIHLFGRLRAHRQKIKQLLERCDYYSCECQRDVELARALGLKGEILPVFPNTGGFDLKKVSTLKQPGPTSKRRLIMLKGYQGWAYRALVGLRALERCADLLKGYTVAIYLVFTEDVQIAAELFAHSTGVPVKMIPRSSHEEILRYHGQARISIGLNISDAISTSFLEALVMGSFPIQSWTACANEWVEDGVTGLLVPPEDPDVIEKAIRRALTDDNLVDRAAELNWKMAVERLDYTNLKSKAIDLYKTVFESS